MPSGKWEKQEDGKIAPMALAGSFYKLLISEGASNGDNWQSGFVYPPGGKTIAEKPYYYVRAGEMWSAPIRSAGASGRLWSKTVNAVDGNSMGVIYDLLIVNSAHVINAIDRLYPMSLRCLTQ